MTAPDNACPVEQVDEARPYPDLLSVDEQKALLEHAEYVWERLQANDLGGFAGINRPFWIAAEFKHVIEKFGRRDVGLRWSNDDLEKARQRTLPPVAEVMERAAQIAENWKSPLKPGTDARLLGHQEAAKTIAAAIRAAALTNLQTGGAPLTDAGAGGEKG